MKLLTVAIPCYNSQDYMAHAIESCLVCKEQVEIIVVNDGSKDDTARIGDEYALKYPGTVKCIHQENGGHGEAVNAGLRNASGSYYKVLDSDDWFDADAFKQVVSTLQQLHDSQNDVDAFFVNYVYEKPSANSSRVIRYTNALPQNQVFGWDDVKKFYPQQNLLMHSVIYRTQMLKDCHLELPKHTFYVDNIFVYQPLPTVKKMYYMNVDLYRYFIGRDDQSVNEKVMISRIDQQLRVNRLMIDCCDLTALENEKCRDYMVKYLMMITSVSSVLLIKSNTKENLQKKDELWAYLKNEKTPIYRLMKKTFLGKFMEVKSYLGKKVVLLGYAISRKIFGFN